MRSFVNHVSFNIQGGGDYDLGSKMLIVGPNRIGKSSIVRAIELATTGRASDVAGRDMIALDAELWTLAGDDVDLAACDVTFSDGKRSTWELPHGKRAKRTGPSAAFPLREVTSAILGSAETARKFFLSVAGAITWETVLSEIPKAFHAKLAPYAPRKGSTDGAEALVAAIEGTKKRARDLASEAKGARESARMQAEGAPPPPAAAEIEKARAAVDGVREGARAAFMDEKIEAARKELRTLSDRRAAMPDPGPTIDQTDVDLITHAIAVLEDRVKHRRDLCVICGSSVSPDVFVKRLEVAKGSTVALLSRSQAHRALAAIEDQIESATRYYNGLVEERKKIGSVVLEAPVQSFEAVLRAAERWDAIRDGEGRAVNLEAEAEEVKKLTELCRTALGRLLERAKTEFEKRVQAFLPAEMRFGIDLHDGDREVFRVGLYRWTEYEKPGVLSTALSGAEWSAVTAAISGAVASTYPIDMPVVIVPEDRDFDSFTLEGVMQSFSGIDAQVIITATKKPEHSVDGWTVIDLPFTAVSTNVDKAGELGRAIALPKGSPDFCVQCNRMVEIGTCKHGVTGRKLDDVVSSASKSILEMLK